MRGMRAFMRSGLAMTVVVAGALAGAGPASAVAGGTDVADGDYPFVVKLRIGDTERACTGVLVHPQLVLTAGVCFAGADGKVAAGEPSLPTTVIAGRTDLTGTGGTVSDVTEVVPNPDRDLALLRLGTPVTTVPPIAIAGTAAAAGDEITVAGYGRTKTTWIQDRLQSAKFTVTGVGSTSLDVAGSPSAAAICKGDAGAPAFRLTSGGAAELVALAAGSTQAGCVGETAAEGGATATRVDGVSDWIAANTPGFGSAFEAADARPNWQNTIDDTGTGHGGMLNVGGVTASLTGAELKTGPFAGAHSGGTILLYSGKDNNATKSYAYTKAYSLTNVTVRASTTLSYWIYPQSTATSSLVSGLNSSCVAVDLIFGNGKSLRDSGATDQRGNKVHPGQQCGKLTMDAWNEVIVPIGAVAAGQKVVKVDVGYDQPANTGGYRGYVDDLKISDVIATPKFATSLETGDPQLTWTSTPDTGDKPRGGLMNVGGVCCNLTGPELKVGPSTPYPHVGTQIILYSGLDNSATKSYAYTKAFSFTDTFVTPSTTLSYWIFPQSNDTSFHHATGSNSTCVSVDLLFADLIAATESSLRDSGAVDQRGIKAHPASQCTKITLDKWNYVKVPLGGVANGKQITQLDIGYDQAANTGGYRGFVDDISISQ
jgi:trypsin